MNHLINQCSVKVMRSHDYCHFEVVLGASDSTGQFPFSPNDVDELRKAAARLADKAVEQYQVMKREAYRRMESRQGREGLALRMKEIADIPEMERTVRQQADLKAYKDANFQAQFDYDYQDDWDEEN